MIDFEGNIKVVGSWYFTRAQAEDDDPPRVMRTWTNEDGPPHRHGRGWGLRLGRVVLVLGRWAPVGEDELGRLNEGLAEAHEIRGWRAPARVSARVPE